MQKGYHHSEKSKERMRLIKIGNTWGFQKGNNWGEFAGIKKGQKPHNWSTLYTPEMNEKRRIALLGKKSPLWIHGHGYDGHEPYSVDWTQDLKRAIRKRDKYTCQVCGKEPSVHVHHIDYDKKNCNSDNLITLCISCHGKTIQNRRYWTNHLVQYRSNLRTQFVEDKKARKNI